MLLGACLLTGSIWFGGDWFISHEMFHALVRLLEFDGALRGGQFPVRWCDNLMAGYGYPLFNFYPPLSFAVAEAFHLAGLGLASAWKAEITLVGWLGGVGMYGLLRRRTGRAAALVGAMLYLFAPYHAMTLYVRGNLPEWTALAAWPWAFWGLDAAMASRRVRESAAIPAAALAVAAIALSHVLTAYSAAFSLAAWGFFLAWGGAGGGPGRPGGPIGRIGLMGRISLFRPMGPAFLRGPLVAASVGFLGAALAAFFWVPAFGEVGQCRPAVLTDLIRVEDHFVYPWQFVVPHWGYGLSLPGPADTISFQLGFALWGGVAAGIALVFRRAASPHRGAILFAVVLLAAHLFAMTPPSKPLWFVIPGARFMQFPWRLLIPATFWASFVGGLAADRFFATQASWTSWRRISLCIVVGLCAAQTAMYAHPLLFHLDLGEYRAEELRLTLVDTTAREYLPRWVEEVPPRPAARELLWISAAGNARLVSADGSAAQTHAADVTREGVVCAQVFWFPGWSAWINGERVETFPATRHGLVGFSVPPGRHEVRVGFRESALRLSADLVSCIAALLTVAWIGLAWRRRRGRGSGNTQ